MKLTTNEIIVLFQALTALQGAPTVIIANGQKQVIHEPYDMGPKFKWNAAKNRSILRRYVDDHDQQVYDFRADLQKQQRLLAEKSDNPQANAAQMRTLTQAVNDEIAKLSKIQVDVEGLLLLPASGLNIKTSKIPPTVIEELMPLIDGVPEFDEPAPKK